jgi:hypothetical protein
MNTPDMSRKAADITDPRELYARIGYRAWLIHRDGPNEFYESWNRSDLRHLDKLNSKYAAQDFRSRLSVVK